MTIRGTLTVIRVKQTINDNSWYIYGNSCKKQPKTIRCNRIFSIPLAGLWKSCNFAGRNQ